MLRTPAVVLALLIAAGLGGCGVVPASAPQPSAEEGTWTVLTYSIADTDLEPFMMDDVDEMGEVGSSEHLNVVALVDRAEGYDDEPVLGLEEWVGAKTLEVVPGGAVVQNDHGDLNTGDPAVLADFLADGIRAYPADHYALILSDHGASWPGVGGDESAGADTLTLEELDRALGDGLAEAGVGKLDLLGFDACLMATYEVASALAPRADRLLASQELEPGHGWDYAALSVLTEPGTSVDELGAAMIDGFEAQAVEQGTEPEITLSLVDLTALPSLDSAVADFTGALIERAGSVSPAVGRTLAETLGFGRSPDPAEDSHLADLGMLAAEIGVDALDVADQADAVVRALNDAIVDKVNGQALSGATGLSVYFPPVSDYFDPEYAGVESNGGWGDFLAAYYSAGRQIPLAEQAQFLPREAEVVFEEEGLSITGYFELAAEDNLAEAFIRYGMVEYDDSITFLGEEPADIAEDGSGYASGLYDLSALVLTDGEDEALAYFELLVDDETGLATIDVPLGYSAPDDSAGDTYQDALLSLLIDPEGAGLLSETYYAYQEELGTYGELTADPSGLIAPEVLNVLDDGTEEWIATTDVGLWADLPSLQYEFRPLDSATRVYIELWVRDFGGNTDVVSAVVQVP
ncbi:clostripain-related cysteine peptidase [Lysobacter korlensis]|uniref:Clostripain-related cysteine peptidase n=1 Tax=Lysobacter korlensis TaxID=553636 RepID=A0ABV6RXD5_9GAMM